MLSLDDRLGARFLRLNVTHPWPPAVPAAGVPESEFEPWHGSPAVADRAASGSNRVRLCSHSHSSPGAGGPRRILVSNMKVLRGADHAACDTTVPVPTAPTPLR